MVDGPYHPKNITGLGETAHWSYGEEECVTYTRLADTLWGRFRDDQFITVWNGSFLEGTRNNWHRAKECHAGREEDDDEF